MDGQARISVESADLRYVYKLLQQELATSLEEAIATEKGEYSEEVTEQALEVARTELRKTFEMARYAVDVKDVLVESREQFRMFCQENYGAEPLDLDLNEQVFSELAEIDVMTDDVAYQRTHVAARVGEMYNEATKARLSHFDALLAAPATPLPELDLPFERIAEISTDLTEASQRAEPLQQEIHQLAARLQDIQNGVLGP